MGQNLNGQTLIQSEKQVAQSRFSSSYYFGGIAIWKKCLIAASGSNERTQYDIIEITAAQGF